MKDLKGSFNELLKEGISVGVFPGCVLLVAKADHILFWGAKGFSTLIPRPQPMHRDTIFDLASLTKPIVTTLCIMKLYEKDIIDLDSPISKYISKYRLYDKKKITIRSLLNHCSGIDSWYPFYKILGGFTLKIRKPLLRRWILYRPLKYSPMCSFLYSDIGFILLEWIIEEVTNKTLDRLFLEYVIAPLKLKDTYIYNMKNNRDLNTIAATEICTWRNRLMHGQTHDENAFSVGGYSGHAGLFSNAFDIFKILNALLCSYNGKRDNLFKRDLVNEFFTRQEIILDNTWALGFDTPSSVNSSAGKFFSRYSVGHLGYTGVSFWMDLKREIIIIFFTNRIHPSRNNIKIRYFRPYLHDKIMQILL